MIRRPLTFALLLGCVSVSACLPIPEATGLPTATPTAGSITPSVTPIIWFPSTETATAAPAPSAEPTAERKPGIGELLITDPMTSTTHWNAATAGSAAVTVSERGLSLAAQSGGPPVISLHRSAVLDNMYMEITARPSLCRDQDAYGVVFRAPNNVAHYQLEATCNGSVAVERVSLGTPRVLQPPAASSDVPAGAPGEVRMGIWAAGSEFRFFLNDHYQFSVTDKNYVAGGIGVFVEARGSSPAVVTFTDLRVYRLLPEAVLPTPTP